MTIANENAEQPRILLVDDNKEMLMAMGAMLGASKFDICTVFTKGAFTPSASA